MPHPRDGVKFYLGTHGAGWLERPDVAVPLFVSRRRFVRRRSLPRAITPWALDSGGFTELSSAPHRWTLPPAAYAAEVRRLAQEVGRLEWAAPQDWMCEPWILERTGLTVVEHQRRTVANFLELRTLDTGARVVPVLQGWTLADYEACVELYDAAGVDLRAEPLVGLGTVCRRQGTDDAAVIVARLHAHGLRLHGFGVKITGLRRFGYALESADSMAWSSWGRNEWHHRRVKLCDGEHEGGCQNCAAWALRWRERVVAGVGLFAAV